MATQQARIDKWLWAARLFKTRSMAATACKNGRVQIGNRAVKPSYMLKEGDVVQVIEQRVGAKLIPEVYENMTDSSQYELLEMNRISGFVNRARGTGRPTKKERRALDAFIDEDDGLFDGEEFDF